MLVDAEPVPEPAPPPTWKAWLVLSCRLLGAGIVIFLAIRHWDRVAQAGRILTQVDQVFWWIAVPIGFASLLVAAVRLSLLLRSVGEQISIASLYGDLVCATAINASLLMGVGDVYRIRQTHRHVRNLPLASSLIVLDRLLGFAAICAAAFLSMAFVPTSDFEFQLRWLGLVTLIGLLGLVLVRGIMRHSRLAVWDNLMQPFASLLRRPAFGLGAMASSMAVCLLWLTSVVVVARGVGIDVPVAGITLAASIATVATVLPISIGGFGVREAGYILVLGNYGVDTAHAIALGVAQYALFLPIIAAGAVLGLIRARRAKRPGPA